MTGKDDVIAEIERCLRPRIGDGPTISTNTNISRDLGLDSVTVMDFIFDLEDNFDISIPMDRIAEVHTVDELAEVIQSLRKETD